MNSKYKIICLWLLLMSGIFLTLLSFKNAISWSVKEEKFYEEGNVNYSVYLKDNNYFTEKFLPEGKQYITSLIDYVDTTFTYTFQGNEAYNYKYSYDITATLVANQKDSPDEVLYDKDFVLKEKEEKSGINPFVINENIKIDYGYFNSIMNEFKSTYALSMDAYLKVQLNIYWDVKEPIFGQKVDKKSSLDLVIPLSEQTIKVGMDTNDINNQVSVKSKPTIQLNNMIYFIMFWIFVLFDTWVAILLLNSYAEERKRKGEYLFKLEKIEKQYDRAIVETNVLPEITSNVIDVGTFEELLDARENVEKPILHKKTDIGSIFMIADDNIVYRYILRK